MSEDPSECLVPPLPETWYGTPVFSVVNPRTPSPDAQDEQFEKRTRYFNYLPEVVTVVERTGLQIDFPPLADASRCEFLIQTDWRIHRTLQTRFLQWLKADEAMEPKHLAKLREVLRRHSAPAWEPWITVRSEVAITHETLRRHRGKIYDQETDIVISTLAGAAAGPHPHSEAARVFADLHARPQTRLAQAFFETLYIVDNEGIFADRFINRNGTVYRIRRARDSGREDGVWVIRKAPPTPGTPREGIGWRRYGFDEADEALELYKSYADAKNYGDGEAKRKREQAAQEAQLVRERRKLAKQKLADQQAQQDWEREKARITAEMERQQAAWASELARLKMEMERARYYYEQQMLEAKQGNERKKEVNEWLRQLPAIASALALAWLTYRTAQLNAK